MVELSGITGKAPPKPPLQLAIEENRRLRRLALELRDQAAAERKLAGELRARLQGATLAGLDQRIRHVQDDVGKLRDELRALRRMLEILPADEQQPATL